MTMNPTESTTAATAGRRGSSRDRARPPVTSFPVKGSNLRRMRGEISCAECRRLKLKCDRTVPCQSCKRRGYESICPNGTMATGDGTKMVMAATEHLYATHERIKNRTRQLEDAIRELQSRLSPSTPHPLLLKLASPNELDDYSPPRSLLSFPIKPSSAPIIAGLTGTLSVDKNGSSRFLGPGGAYESFLSEAESNGTLPSSPSSPKCGLARLCPWFPFAPPGHTSGLVEHLRADLPPWDRAVTLATVYSQQAVFLVRGLTGSQLMDEMLPAVYLRNLPLPEGHFDYASPHALALLFGVLAIGTLFDPSSEPFDPEADRYADLAAAALGLQSPFDRPSSLTVQCLQVMYAFYNMRGGDVMDSDAAMETVWSLISLAAQISQLVGLHRDPERFSLSASCIERRRVLFWDIYNYDTICSLSTGRPPVFGVPYIDCRFPADLKTYDDESHPWRHGHTVFRFIVEVIGHVTRTMLTAEPPSYGAVLALDHKVRSFLLPSLPLPPPEDGPVDPGMAALAFYSSYVRETTLLFIHRRFFAQALIDHPENPLDSPYKNSFKAAYETAHAFLRSMHYGFARLPRLIIYVWTAWTQAFSCAVTLGSLVTKSPHFAWSPAAMCALNGACELFEHAGQMGGRAEKALPILLKLRDKARDAIRTTGLPESEVLASTTGHNSMSGVRSTSGSPFDNAFQPFLGSMGNMPAHVYPQMAPTPDLDLLLQGANPALSLDGLSDFAYTPSPPIHDLGSFGAPMPGGLPAHPIGPSYGTNAASLTQAATAAGAWPEPWALTVPGMHAHADAAASAWANPSTVPGPAPGHAFAPAVPSGFGVIPPDPTLAMSMLGGPPAPVPRRDVPPPRAPPIAPILEEVFNGRYNHSISELYRRNGGFEGTRVTREQAERHGWWQGMDR